MVQVLNILNCVIYIIYIYIKYFKSFTTTCSKRKEFAGVYVIDKKMQMKKNVQKMFRVNLSWWKRVKLCLNTIGLLSNNSYHIPVTK